MTKNKKSFGDRLRGAAAAVFGPSFRVDADPDSFWQIWGTPRTSSGQVVTQRTALGLPAVFACVRVISDTVGPLPVRLVRESDDGTSSEVVTDHPVADLLREPNTPAGYGMPSLLKTSQTKFQLWGDDYIQIERSRSGTPVKLWALDPETTPLVPDTTNRSERGIVGYRTTINGDQVDLKPADVIHIRDMSIDGIIGMSKVRLASQTIGAGLAMEEYLSHFFKNDLMSGGYFVHPGRMDQKSKGNFVDAVEKQTLDKTTNRKQHFKPKILEDGIKWIQTTISPEQAQLSDGREQIVSEIARIYGVPLMLVQSRTGSTVWGTGIEQLMIGFAQLTILPIVVLYEDEMSRKLLTIEERKAGLRIRFDLGNLLRGDQKTLAESNDLKIRNGTMTPNEARKMDGRNPLPGGDKALNLSEIEAAKKAAPPAAGDPKKEEPNAEEE